MPNVAEVMTVNAYSEIVNVAPYQGSKAMILADPNFVKWDPRARQLMVRSIEVGNASDFDNYWNTESAGGDSVRWHSIPIEHKRKKQIIIPYADEMASYEAGMKSSIVMATEQYFNEKFAEEFDATTFTRIFGSTREENKFTENQKSVTSDNIFDTLDDIIKDEANRGFGRSYPIDVFIAETVYSGLNKYVRLNSGLANPNVLTRIDGYNLKFKDDRINGDNGGHFINTEILKYNNLNLIPVPDDRMNTAITMLSGKGDQSAGGWIKSETSKQIYMLVIPRRSAFAGVQINITNFHVPVMGAPISNYTVGLDQGLETVLGNVTIENGGINQLGANYQVNIGTFFGAAVMPLRDKGIIAITKA